jgi:Skp family chaperone for outer membrane proteins
MSRLYDWTAKIVTVLSVSIAAQSVLAQDAPPPRVTRATAGPTIALLDVAYIFKYHTRFKAMMAEWKRECERAETETRTQKNAIVQLGERLQEYRSDSPEYKELEARFLKRQADFTAKLQLRKRDLARREAKIWCGVYKEICDATNYYMQQHDVGVVLRFSGEPVDPDQVDSVRDLILRPVVAYRSDLDITPAILRDLNRPDPNQAVPAQQLK